MLETRVITLFCLVLILFTGRQLCRGVNDLEVNVQVPECSDQLPMLSTAEEIKVGLYCTVWLCVHIMCVHLLLDVDLSCTPVGYDVQCSS